MQEFRTYICRMLHRICILSCKRFNFTIETVMSFIPSFIETNVHADVTHHLSLAESQVGGLGNRRKLTVIVGKLCFQPIACGGVGFLNRLV